MEEILQAIQEGVKRVSKAIYTKDLGFSDTKNSSGEVQLKLDIQSDKIFEEELSKVKSLKAIASEEKKEVKEVEKSGEFLVAYDPLDGSSLVDVNLSVGSIFGIYKGEFQAKNLVGAVYAVYGPRVELVVAVEEVKRYLLLEDEFSYFETLTLKERGKINAPGGTQKYWYPYHKELIESFFQEGYRLRYSGGMVPDLHQILVKGGGIFSYPGTTDKPQGKLRKLFEVFPFAFVFEKAKGKAIDGKVSLLDLECNELHETTPCFFGSTYEIERVKEIYGQV